MNRRLMRLICLVLVALFLANSIQVTAMATAEADNEKEIVIGVDTEAGKKELRVKQIKGTWFAEVYSLAAMAECTVSFNEGTGFLRVSRPTSQVTLYVASNEDEYSIQGSSIYVPLDKCAQSLGLRFQRYIWKDGLYVTTMKTPADLRRVVQTIFARNCYHLWEVPDELGLTWDRAEFFARLWAAMPFVGSGSMIGTISGQDEQERYDRAIKSILDSSGSFLELIYTWADTDKSLKDIGKKLSAADDVIDTVWGWIDNDESLCKKLNEAGIYETVREMFRTGSNPYEEDIGDFLKGYPTVANAMNINYWLETFAFYGAAVDGDEAMLLAMNKVFGNSSNKFLRSSAEKLFDSQFGKGKIAISDIYGGYVKDFLFSQITDKLEDALYGGEMSLVGKFASMGITEFLEYKFDSPSINGISDAMIYYSIYSTISVELTNYYYQHRYDNTEHIGADLRAIALMYLNTARACVDKCRFDSSLDDATTNMDAIIDADLIALLEFADQEYDPTFTNVEILNYLETLPDQPQSGINNNTQGLDKDEIFDETFWFFSFGQTLGSNFDALFHKNGTFTARSYGSGTYDDGTYTYKNGVLTINFWFTGNGCIFEGDASGFVSRKKYQMQVGEDYYTIAPIPGGSSFYFETAPTPAPANNQNDIFDETLWRIRSDGGVTGEFDALFHKNGTFNARCFDDGKYYDGTYIYNNDILTVEFLPSDLNWFNNRHYIFKKTVYGFETEATEPGWGYEIYQIDQSDFYYPEYLSDGEFYGLLTDWNDKMMTVELLNYEGRNELSYNYSLSSTGKYVTIDISQAIVCLEYAWNDGVEVQCKSIDDALNTEVWGGPSTLWEQCTMQISFTIINNQVTKIVFLYAA